VARVVFDVDDIDAAFEELDARYLVGEAVEYSHAWSVVAEAYAAFNRRELFATTPDWVNIDHRRGAAFAPGDMIAYIQAAWDDSPDTKIYIAAVHRLSNLGAVVTHVAHGLSQDGFDAEWWDIHVLTVEGDMLSRSELFDEADIDAALARFDELSRLAPRLKNAASQVCERFWRYFEARDWIAMAQTLADDMFADDRRTVVSAEARRGSDAATANLRALVDIGTENVTSTVVATRGERLALSRYRFSGRDQRPDAFHSEVLCVVEIDRDNRVAAHIMFDVDQMDTAFEELDVRYVAGEAAAHAHTWSVVAKTHNAINRRELPPTTPDWASIDHRQGTAFAPGEMTAYIRAAWDLEQDVRIYIEAVHRLTHLVAVFTHAAYATSQQGFDAEWRMVELLTVEGDRINRCELFDEADIDTALARFEELHPQARRLENEATRVYERFQAYFVARDWNGITETLAADHHSDDRRRVVNAGIRHGRDAEIASMQATADLGVTSLTSIGIAIRGDRLALCRTRGATSGSEAFDTELLRIVEIDADDRITTRVVFDLDDIDAALEELDARYLAGEAAPHSHTWSVIAQTYAALNRHEMPPTTSDFVNIDRRRGTPFASSDMTAAIRAFWDLTPHYSTHLAAVHRLSNRGAVITQATSGTSQQGFDAEWREIGLVTVEGDLINRSEVFDEADLDAALARFEELHPETPRLENTAIRTWARAADAFNRRDLEGFLALAAEEGRYDDRRKGLRAVHEGPARRKGMQGLFEAPKSWRQEVEPIAIRGSSLSLTRDGFRDTNEADRPITLELLTVAEVGDDDRLHDTVHFDPDDIDAAFEELDTRYLAGEAAAHAQTWSAIERAYAALNRRVLPATTPDWINIDHRRTRAFAPGDLFAFLHAAWEVTPNLGVYVVAVHRLNDLGAVFTHAARGTSQEGFDAEWREIVILTFEGVLIRRCEIFDEADIDAALARFDELNCPKPLLENAATRTWAGLADAFNRREMDAVVALYDAAGRCEDRRKGLRNEGPLDREFARALLFEAPANWRLEFEPVATRGRRLALTRDRFRDTDEADRLIAVELLALTEVADDELVSYSVLFDPDDINGALAELTARWIASGEVAHPEIIKSVDRLNQSVSRHDWDAIAAHFADATYVNHRQLANAGNATVADWLSSMRTIASLIPDFWVEFSAVLACSATGIVGHMALKGTSTDGASIEIPYILLILLDGDRLTRFEAFDEDQRDLALARFEELITPD
jgi:hypothetical protein